MIQTVREVFEMNEAKEMDNEEDARVEAVYQTLCTRYRHKLNVARALFSADPERVTFKWDGGGKAQVEITFDVSDDVDRIESERASVDGVGE